MKRNFLLTVVLILGCLSLALADLELEYRQDTKLVRSELVGKIEYLSLSDLCQAIQGSWYWNPVNKKLTLTLEERQFKFTLFSPYIQVDQESYNLSYPVEFRQADLYAPVAPLLDILQSALAIQVEWKPGDRKISVKQRELDITSLKAIEKINGVLLEIFLNQPLTQYEFFAGEDKTLHLNFFSAKLNPDQLSNQSAGSAVEQVKAYQFPDNSSQISIRFRRTFNKIQIPELKDDPLRLRIALTDTTILTQNTNGAFGQENPSVNNPIDLIVIDPGHGGEDTGAKGPGGVMEKDIVLEISKKVAEKLRAAGFKVLLTREEDVFIPLGERTALANRKGADLFISIHANAAKRKQASGSETYFLSRAKNDEALAVAALENASLRFERPDFDLEGMEDLDFILLDMVQNEFLKESQDLAAKIQDGMEKHLTIPNRGVDQAGFFVLNKAYMPAVLVETAFISNANEAKLLQKESFQEKIAQAVTDAVIKFKQKYEKINDAGLEP